jgi:DNA-binding beta-propeller fold protein YncE
MTASLAALLLTTLVTGGGPPPSPPPSAAPPPAFSRHAITLPGAAAEGVSMDYLAYDRAHRRVWVPAGNTGAVAVIDAGTDQVARIEGFPTNRLERNGTTRTVGPSSVTVGSGTVYVGNRGDSNVCAIDADSLRKGPCLRLESMPDGLAYVASRHEVWATLPHDRSIAVIDAAHAGALTRSATIRLSGQPEGFAVDDSRGLFYTNLEDSDHTLTLDVRRRRVVGTWRSGCGTAGPRGLALDPDRNVLFVACTDRVIVLDAAHAGKPLSSVGVGDGLDNIDYVERRHELYAAAARAATLTIARLGADGTLATVAVVPTASGARNAVATDEGRAYLADSAGGAILVVTPDTPP